MEWEDQLGLLWSREVTSFSRMILHDPRGISHTVKDLVAGSGLVFEDAGEHELRGVPDRWQLYRVAG